MFLSKEYNGIYYLYYLDQQTGKRKKVSTKTKVKSLANKFMLNFKPKIHEESVKICEINLQGLQTEVMNYVSTHYSEKTIKLYEGVIRNMILIVGNKHLKQLAIQDIELYKAKRLEVINKTSINIEIRTLKAILNFAVRWNYIKHNPAKEVNQMIVEQKEKLSFSDSEVELIIKNIEDKTLKCIVLIGLMTGCRLNEICNIQFGDIDLKDHILRIRNKPNFKTKTGRIRNIPISNDLYYLIESIIKTGDNVITLYSDEDYLLRNKRNVKFNKDYISRSFKKVLRKLNMPEKYHFHCLRHTFITKLIKNGVPINYVKELAGHSQIETTLGYVHIVTDDLRKAMETLTNFTN